MDVRLSLRVSHPTAELQWIAEQLSIPARVKILAGRKLRGNLPTGFEHATYPRSICGIDLENCEKSPLSERIGHAISLLRPLAPRLGGIIETGGDIAIIVGIFVADGDEAEVYLPPTVTAELAELRASISISVYGSTQNATEATM